ncbi:signal peptidase I [Microbacterium sp. Yaish 1]|uniref:signal peptidase I n=1 Tax=Microbacterium sp. Yaish 1 TaxID=2025014 RepID=UPI000B93C0F6|nr:signal peptidase I [Microbacterium sp. Yaish 1]OYC97735.1 signal peptidase I [Microbacterium sp. Yaish 1]
MRRILQTRNPGAVRTARAGDTARWFDSPWRIALRAVFSAVVVIAIAAVVALVAVPRVSGGDALTVLSGSMEPTFSAGDVIVVAGADPATVCTDVSIGSIVTFFPEPNDPTLVTHRVVGKTIGSFADGTDCRLITQGDANTTADAPVSPEQVRGTFLYGIPGVGWIRQWIAENPLLAAGGLAALIAAWLLWAPRRRRTTVIPAMPQPAPARRDDDAELRLRELDLRERELELRERELELALRRASGSASPPATDEVHLDTPLFEALEQVLREADPGDVAPRQPGSRYWSEQ